MKPSFLRIRSKHNTIFPLITYQTSKAEPIALHYKPTTFANLPFNTSNEATFSIYTQSANQSTIPYYTAQLNKFNDNNLGLEIVPIKEVILCLHLVVSLKSEEDDFEVNVYNEDHQLVWNGKGEHGKLIFDLDIRRFVADNGGYDAEVVVNVCKEGNVIDVVRASLHTLLKEGILSDVVEVCSCLTFKQDEDVIQGLTPEEEDILDREGYVILSGFLSKEACQVFRSRVFNKEYWGLDKDDPDTYDLFYHRHGMTNIWHLPEHYAVRLDKRLYNIFSQILNTRELITSMDRLSFKPPCLEQIDATDVKLHTDGNYWYSNPKDPQFQGGLCLADCPKGNGGFFCIPRFNEDKIVAYKEAFESGAFGNANTPGKKSVFCIFQDNTQEPIEIPLNTGDVIIWNNNLPHNGSKNILPQWRCHAFVRFLSIDRDSHTRVEMSRNRTYKGAIKSAFISGHAPSSYPTGNGTKLDKEDREKEIPFHYEYRLNSEQKRLLGLKNYPDR